MDWREKLFGKVLVKCESVGAQETLQTVPTAQALAECAEEGEGPACGIYFSFANISDESDDFGPRLLAVFHAVHPRLLVVQVVLWAHQGTPEGPVEREHGFRRSLAGKPWFAVPFNNVDTKRRLTQKFGIAVGVPTLVVRGRHVRDALLADPAGAACPWPAPQLRDVLRGVPLDAEDGTTTTYDELPEDAVKLFYFAAHWCPPCRSFAPSLVATLSAVRKRRAKYANCQLILVSSDRSEQSFRRTVSSVAGGGVRAVRWGAAAARAAVGAALDVRAIPALRVLLPGATTAPAHAAPHADLRAQLAADPQGLNFPWTPRPVTILTEQALLKMARHPALVLFIEDEDAEIEFAESVLTPCAESYYEECSMQFPGFSPQHSSSDDELDFEYVPGRATRAGRRQAPRHALFLAALGGSDAAELLREHAALGDAEPLLVAVDFPRQRLVRMRDGDAITTRSVQHFLDAYLSGTAHFQPLKPYTDKC